MLASVVILNGNRPQDFLTTHRLALARLGLPQDCAVHAQDQVGPALLPNAQFDSDTARLIRAVSQRPDRLGISIGPDTAIVIEGTRCTVIGSGTVCLLDGRSVNCPSQSAVFNIRAHLLAPGDQFDLASTDLQIAPARPAPPSEIRA